MMKDAGDSGFVALNAAGGSLLFDPSIGNLRDVFLRDGGRDLRPLNTAHWVGNFPLPDGLAPVEQFLSGDFFCAPFGAGGSGGPPHGWTANSNWQVEATGTDLTAHLQRDVQGARVDKRITLSDAAPLLLQDHLITGGTGPLTFAHHPMVKLAGTGRFATSTKRVAITPDTPLEPSHALRYPAASQDLTQVAGSSAPIDITRLPIATRSEDFITLVEAETTLGWSAVTRDAEDDIVFFLKSPAQLPVTMLWNSNGGRAYAPWNGLHSGVIGIEDGCAAGLLPPAEAARPNAISRTGVHTHIELSPGTAHRIAHVTGAIARPEGWTTVAAIALDGDRLILTGDTGTTRTLPFPRGFLEQET